jgi:hypothetical protein
MKRCSECRSTYVTLALEIPTRQFFICGSCGHRWSEASDNGASNRRSPGFSRLSPSPPAPKSSKRPGL